MKDKPLPARTGEPPPGAPPVYRSEMLLGPGGQACIVHRGQRYVLRQTRTGRLILNK